MKNTNVAVLISLLLIISSCCTKKKCDSYFDFRLYNFKAEDVDTVIVKTYKKNTNIFIDSLRQFGLPSSDSSYYYVPFFNLQPDSIDLLVILPGPGKQYYLNNFKTSKAVCNNCFIGNDYFETISGCNINGSYQDNPVKITY